MMFGEQKKEPVGELESGPPNASLRNVVRVPRKSGGLVEKQKAKPKHKKARRGTHVGPATDRLETDNSSTQKGRGGGIGTNMFRLVEKQEKG